MPKPKKIVKKYSVTQYAEELEISREAVLKKINQNKLPKGVTAELVGTYYVITVES